MSYKEKLAEITKRYGEEMHANLAQSPEEVEVISSGVLSLDAAMKIPLPRTNGKPVLGGYARGKVQEVFGPDAGGKSTMAMAHLAEVSKLGGTGLYIDVEQKASPHYFKSIFREQGADPSCIEIINPPHAEAVWETVQALAPEVDSIVIDSLAEMMTRARLDADVGEQQPGMLARIVQDGLKKSQIWSTDCVLLLINQVRERIGGYSNWNERTSGGRYRLHKAVMRIRVSRTKSFSESGKEIGVGVRAKIHKNQLGAPYGECLFRLYWGSGVDRHGDMIEVADELGLLAKSGSWYYLVYDNKYMGEENKRQGRDAVRVVFDEHPEMYDQLADKIAQVTQTGSID